MTHQQISLVKETWLSVAALDPIVVGNIFYTKLFSLSPEVKPLFKGAIPEQSKKLLFMLNYVISKLDKLEDIVEEIKDLARRHIKYGVKEEHYTAVGAALLSTLETGLGDAWTASVKEAWIACYTLLSTAMINASAYTSQPAQ